MHGSEKVNLYDICPNDNNLIIYNQFKCYLLSPEIHFCYHSYSHVTRGDSRVGMLTSVHPDLIVAVNFHQRWVFFADFSVNSKSISMKFCKHSFQLFQHLP